MPAKMQAPSTMPAAAQRLWQTAYNAAWDASRGLEADKKSKKAEAVALRAVKRQYVPKGEKWVAKQSLILAAMPVVKLSMSNKRMRWLSTIVTDKVNTKERRLDESLFLDFAYNFNADEPPSLDLVHLSSILADPALAQLARIGVFDRVYQERGDFKAGGYYFDTPIAAAIFNNAKEGSGVALQTSAGFVPDIGNIRFVDDILTYYGGRGVGYIDHGAVTTYPIDQYTDLESMEEGMQLYADSPTVADDFKRLFGKHIPADLHPLIEALGLGDDLLLQGGPKRFFGSVLNNSSATLGEDVLPSGFDEDSWAFPDNWPTAEALAPYLAAVPAAAVAQSGADRTPNVDGAILAKFQRNRARASGIAVKQSGHKLPPSGNADEEGYGDPTNYLYPCHDAYSTAQSAEAWGKPQARTSYLIREQALVTSKLGSALQKFCGYDSGYGTMQEYEYQPSYGNAMTLADAAAYDAATSAAWDADSVLYRMQAVMENINHDDSIDAGDKAAAIKFVVAEAGKQIAGLAKQSAVAVPVVAQAAVAAPPIPNTIMGQLEAKLAGTIPETLAVKPAAQPAAARPVTQSAAEQVPMHRVAASFADAIEQLAVLDVSEEERYAATGEAITVMARQMQTAVGKPQQAAAVAKAEEAAPVWAQQLLSTVATLVKDVGALKQQGVVSQSGAAAASNVPMRPQRKGLSVKTSAIIERQNASWSSPAKTAAEVVERLAQMRLGPEADALVP